MRYCEDYAALLDLYVDGELSPEDLIRVQAHLDECPACQGYVDDALAMRAAFPDVEDTIVPDGFADGVMARIQANTVSKKRKRPPWAKVLLPLAACCAIVILLQNIPGMFYGKTEEAAFTEETQAEAPAAAMDTVTTEAAEPAEGEARFTEDAASVECQEAPADLAETEKEDADTSAALASSKVYLSTTFLPAECAELLEAYTPKEETDTEIQYELTPSEYQTLLAQLESAQFSYMSEDGITPTTDTVLVILAK